MFKLPEISKIDKDFVVYAAGVDLRSDPDVFLSTKPFKDPSADEDNPVDTILCENYGTDVCRLPLDTIKKNFKNKDEIYFDIKCWYKCDAKFRIMFVE